MGGGGAEEAGPTVFGATTVTRTSSPTTKLATVNPAAAAVAAAAAPRAERGRGRARAAPVARHTSTGVGGDSGEDVTTRANGDVASALVPPRTTVAAGGHATGSRAREGARTDAAGAPVTRAGA